MNKILVGRKEVSKFLGVHSGTLKRWEKIKPLPKVGPLRRVYVLESELIEWFRKLRDKIS